MGLPYENRAASKAYPPRVMGIHNARAARVRRKPQYGWSAYPTVHKQSIPSIVAGLPLHKKKNFFRPPTMRMLENRLIIHYVPQAFRRTSAGKIFSYFPHRLEVRRNRNLRWLLATFGQSKVTRRQAKPDHLMCHEKKEIAPSRVMRKRAALTARGCQKPHYGWSGARWASPTKTAPRRRHSLTRHGHT